MQNVRLDGCLRSVNARPGRLEAGVPLWDRDILNRDDL